MTFARLRFKLRWLRWWLLDRRRLHEPVDFSCWVCGTECASAPDPPERAVCPEHCPDHDYRYSREERTHYCYVCGQLQPEDWE
jgi:hypothetical protein